MSKQTEASRGTQAAEAIKVAKFITQRWKSVVDIARHLYPDEILPHGTLQRDNWGRRKQIYRLLKVLEKADLPLQIDSCCSDVGGVSNEERVRKFYRLPKGWWL